MASTQLSLLKRGMMEEKEMKRDKGKISKEIKDNIKDKWNLKHEKGKNKLLM
jgi:hypothetical protein